MAISINKVSEETQNQIIEAYINNMSLREIEKKFHVTRATVSKFLEEKQIKTTKGNHYRKYFHQEDFFEKIDNEEKAYWLGFMFADGYISEKRQGYGQDLFGITLKIDDENHLIKFKKSISSTNPINYDYSKTNAPQCKILMTSQKTVNDLIRHGCVKHKSLILQPPQEINNLLLRHFIRGYFDGDGSITKTHTPGRNFITKEFCYGINIVGTKEMCEWLQEFFSMGSVIKDQRKTNSYYYSLGGRLQLQKFFHLLYDEATIYMDRKYDRFKEFC